MNRTKKPLIAIFGSRAEERTMQGVRLEYMRAIAEAGGIPVLAPMIASREVCRDIAERFDGFLFAGGVDLDPALFGEIVDRVHVRDIRGVLQLLPRYTQARYTALLRSARRGKPGGRSCKRGRSIVRGQSSGGRSCHSREKAQAQNNKVTALRSSKYYKSGHSFRLGMSA